jgi:hypothetical protein
MIVSAHRGVGMKIHTTRLMASMINTSRSKISDTLAVDGGTLAIDGGTLAVGDGTLAVDSITLMVDNCMLMVGNDASATYDYTLAFGGATLMSAGGTRTIDDSTLTVGGGTLMSADDTQTVDDSTRTVDGGTLTSDDQHQLNSAIASMTWWRQHATGGTDSPTMCRLGKIFTFFLLYYFLVTQYLYADQTSCHISKVIGNVMANVASAVPSPA